MEQPALSPNLKNSIKDYLSKFDLNLCLTCGTCTNGCPVTGGEGAEGLDTRKVLRMLALGMVDEVVESKFPWLCTGCGRIRPIHQAKTWSEPDEWDRKGHSPCPGSHK
jgi:heterodisulfide reductase subunit C